MGGINKKWKPIWGDFRNRSEGERLNPAFCLRFVLTFLIVLVTAVLISGCETRSVDRGTVRVTNSSTNDLANPYYSKLGATIQHQWYELLKIDPPKQTGKVVVNFRLFANGLVRHVQSASSTMEEI